MPAASLGEVVETHRIRVTNQAGGPIEVSLDRGLSYQRIGRVTRAATQNSDAAVFAGAVPTGRVALVGATRVWVRSGAEGGGPRIFALHAAGMPSPPWAISTDLAPGSPLFEALAPPLGSRLYLQASRALRPLPAGYVPTRGDTLVIVATLGAAAGDAFDAGSALRAPPTAIVWENRAGGRVTALLRGGEQEWGRVRHPVRGVGRYPATTSVAPGRIAEHHAHALLISTAGPGGSEKPAAGGFRIEVAAGAEAVSEQSAVLVIEPARGVDLLTMPISLDAGTRLEMRVGEGPWMPLPRVTGAVPDAWTRGLIRLAAPGLPEESEGVRQFRLLFGGVPALRRAALAQAVREARERVDGAPVTVREHPSAFRPPAAGAPSGPAYRGKLTVRANVTGRGISYVVFRLDGKVVKITNVPPFTWEWDTREVANGEHLLEILGKDAEGNEINRRVTRVRVEN